MLEFFNVVTPLEDRHILDAHIIKPLIGHGTDKVWGGRRWPDNGGNYLFTRKLTSLFTGHDEWLCR